MLYQYVNGGYKVSIFETGTKIREKIGSTSPVHPEQMDLKITDWCDAGCPACHEQSTKRGKHGDVDKMVKLLSTLPTGVEIAIGGGDPLSHPDFERLIYSLRDIGLIPSVTVNGRHLARSVDRLERFIGDKALFGVGVSYWEGMIDWEYEHKVIHMINGIDSPEVLDNWEKGQKILLLGYKNFGRGIKYNEKNAEKVLALINQWYRELIWIAKDHKVSFDTLAITQMNPRRLFANVAEYDQRFMGEEGQFSMYVDGVTETFAVSSYSEKRFEWSNINDMFKVVRNVAGHEVLEVA